MTYRIRLLFNDGKEPMMSLTRHDQPTTEEAVNGMSLYDADRYEIIETQGGEDVVILSGEKTVD